MQIQRNSRVSRLSSSNNRSSLVSVMSLERVSSHRNSSLTHRVSLVNAMDLQSSLRSNRTGRDELMGMDDSRRQSLLRRESNKEQEPYSYQPNVKEMDLSSKSQFRIEHQCQCAQQECEGQHCICYLTPREICVIGLCCGRCIAAKNQYLKQARGFTLERESAQAQMRQEQHRLALLLKQKNCKNLHYFRQVHANEPCMKDVVFCTCKKSHCQKKYCLCFEKGVRCGQFCVCVECENRKDEEEEWEEQEKRRWERYATYVPYQAQERPIEDIQQFLGEEEEEGDGEFPQVMEFEPVNFDHLPAQ